MKRFLYHLIFMIGIFLIACDEESTPTNGDPYPVIESISVSDKWNSASTRLDKIEVKVTDPQGFSNISGVWMEVTNPIDQVIFSDSLYDDGAYVNRNDGDVIANDGIYSNQFSSVEILAGAAEGEYEFSFQAIDQENHESNVFKQSALFGPNSQPEIISVLAPDTLFSGTNSQIIELAFTDADGFEDVVRGYFDIQDGLGNVIDNSELFNDGNFSLHGDLFANDSIFSMKFDSSFAVGKVGVHTFHFYVEDSFNEKNINVPVHTINLENNAGEIISTNVPDSLNRPQSNFNRKLMTVQVNDPQGLADIDSVYFFSLKPDSTFANQGNPILMVDNGLPFNINNPAVEVGDEIANDGIFSFSLLSFPGDSLGVYKFSFLINDFVGNTSSVVQDSIIIY